MEFHSNHPLENITRNNPYSILEALIPFVDYPMKLPLALLVKYQEVRLILNAFQSTDTLSKYGLHNSSTDPMDMMANIMGVSPEMLKTLMSIMETQKSNYNTSSETMNSSNNNTSSTDYVNHIADTNNLSRDDSFSNTNTTTNYSNATDYNNQSSSHSDILNQDPLDENIKNIFAEYDLLQAAEYNEKNRELQANSIDMNLMNPNISDADSNNTSVYDGNEPEYYI
ncbi:MAG: hypothetical protein IJ232_01865 [Lachnospiraceae bacterium]|nr:hypothetical protein [Lachnospiraceae bacterium]